MDESLYKLIISSYNSFLPNTSGTIFSLENVNIPKSNLRGMSKDAVLNMEENSNSLHRKGSGLFHRLKGIFRHKAAKFFWRFIFSLIIIKLFAFVSFIKTLFI